MSARPFTPARAPGTRGPVRAVALLPWAGFAVLCGWTVLALAGARYLLRRRDA